MSFYSIKNYSPWKQMPVIFDWLLQNLLGAARAPIPKGWVCSKTQEECKMIKKWHAAYCL